MKSRARKSQPVPAAVSAAGASARVRLPTEDDADVAVSRQRLATEKRIPFRKVLKELGYELDSSRHVRKSS